MSPGSRWGRARLPQLAFVFPGPARATARSASSAGSCGPGPRATAPTTTPGSSSLPGQRAVEPRRDDRPARRRQGPAGAAARPGDRARHRPGRGHRRRHRPLHPRVPGATRHGDVLADLGRRAVAHRRDPRGLRPLDLADGDVPRLVQPFAVHYVSASRRATVPDVRWFPLDRLATRLARAQLDPVPDHLVGAATTAVPGRAPASSATRCRSTRRRRGGQPHREPAGRRGGDPPEPLGPVPHDPDPGHHGHRHARSRSTAWRSTSTASTGRSRRSSRVGFPAAAPVDLRDTGRAPRRDVSVFDPSGRRPAAGPAGRRRIATTRPCRRSTPTSRCPPTGPSSPPSTRPVTASRAGGGPPATRCPASAPTSARRRTTGSASSGPVGSVRGRGRLWVVDTRADPADPEAAAARRRCRPTGSRGAGSSRPGSPPTATGSSSSRRAPTAPRPTFDLAGVVRGAGQRPERLSAPLRLGAGSPRPVAWPGSTTSRSRPSRRSARPPPARSSSRSTGAVTAAAGRPGRPGGRDVGGERDLYVSPRRAGCSRASGRALGRQRAGRPTSPRPAG